MNKIKLLVLFTLVSFFAKGQSLDWEVELGKKIYDYRIYSDKVVLVYGDYNGNKVVKSKRLYPDVVVLNRLTGEKMWEIKEPMEMMGTSKSEKNSGSAQVYVRRIKNTKMIRVGRMLLLGDKGEVLFNPTKAGITNILYSKVFPEGILANAKLNGDNVVLFLSFDTFSVAWSKQGSGKESIKGLSNFALGMMSKDPASKRKMAIHLSKSPFYNGYYTEDGNYIVQSPEKGEITSFNLKTGNENWKYKSEIAFSHYNITENENTKKITIHLVDQLSRMGNKHNIIALDGDTGNVLWQKDEGFAVVNNLSVIDDLGAILVQSSSSKLGKKYFQIFDDKGQEKLENNTLRSFGTTIEEISVKDNLLTIVSKSGQSNEGPSVGILKIPTKTGTHTKFLEYINIIDLKTGKYVFENRIKTSDRVIYTKLYGNNKFLVVQPNRIQLFDAITQKEIGKSIKSTTPFVFVEDDKGIVYITSEKAGYIYTVNNQGEITSIGNLRKNNSKIEQIHEIITLDNGSVLLHGLTNKDEIVLTKIGSNGVLEYEKTYDTPDYKKSWKMPIVEDTIYIYCFDENGTPSVGVINMQNGNLEHRFTYSIESTSHYNEGDYYVSKKTRTIYHAPKARLKSPFDKKSGHFNSKGVFTLKKY